MQWRLMIANLELRKKLSSMSQRCVTVCSDRKKKNIIYLRFLFILPLILQVEQLKELSKLPDIYERLTKSLAPNIWELDDVKKGLLCQVPL